MAKFTLCDTTREDIPVNKLHIFGQQWAPKTHDNQMTSHTPTHQLTLSWARRCGPVHWGPGAGSSESGPIAADSAHTDNRAPESGWVWPETDLYTAFLRRLSDEQVALAALPPHHTAETVGGVSNANWQNTAVQQSIDDAALAIGGAAKEGHFHPVSAQNLLDLLGPLHQAGHAPSVGSQLHCLQEGATLLQPLAEVLEGSSDRILCLREPLQWRRGITCFSSGGGLAADGERSVQLRSETLSLVLAEPSLLSGAVPCTRRL